MSGFNSPPKAPKEPETPRQKFEFKDLVEAEEYLSWKEEVPELIQKAVESTMLLKTPAFDTDLSHTKEFLGAFHLALLQKRFSADISNDILVINSLAPLERVETKVGFLNLFGMMTDIKVSWALKKKLYDTQIRPAYEWIIEKDLLENMAKAEEELSKESDQEQIGGQEKESKSDDNHEVPPSSGESVSSMEAGGEKKEGAPKEQFTVTPFYGGYAKSDIYNHFDLKTLRFVPKNKELKKLDESEAVSLEKSSARVMYGLIRGGAPLAIPLYYNFSADEDSLMTNAGEGKAKFLKDQDGVWHLLIDEPGIWNYRFITGKVQSGLSEEKKEDFEMDGELPEELRQKIKELKKSRMPPLKLARETVKLIRNHLTYSNSNEAWKKYAARPSDFFKELWNGKEADCQVSNTLACLAHQEAGTLCRFIGGHYVKDKNEKGEAIMHSGSGHAWHEVWDNVGRKWVRLDATPKGDPTVDEAEQEKDLEGNNGNDEGDYGENDEIMNEKELKKQIDKMKQKSGGGKSKKKSVKIEEASFAVEAGCSDREAQEFLKALERVREIKNEKNESISELLIKEWQRIVEERKIEKSEYRGPVRMDEGEVLEDPVSAAIDLRAKEYNPTGFGKEYKVEKREYDFGGINLFFSFDLSGSMNNFDSVSGRAKADVQRDAGLLFIDSLMQCAFLHRRDSAETDLLPLKIMATVASSRGQTKLPLTDRWGPKEQWQFYSALNQLASGGTPTHETLELIKGSLIEEREVLKKKNIPEWKMPIDYCIEISDGIPEDLAETIALHDDLKENNMILRGYLIGGKEIDRPEYTSLASFSDLPQTMSKDIIEQFKKLRPRRVK
ncbi:MAG: transglutaminase domain-containing protein [bacterium]|nr:transglutaminase domain-containing protein [bacterium]